MELFWEAVEMKSWGCSMKEFVCCGSGNGDGFVSKEGIVKNKKRKRRKMKNYKNKRE